MRRSGVFALITYVLYTLLFGGLTLVFLHWLENDGKGLLDFPPATLIIALILGLCEILAISALVEMVLKILHMVTGWVIFAIPCILFDAYVVFHIVSSVFPAVYTDSITQGVNAETIIIVIIGIIVPLFFSVGALVSNIKSLQN